jgi:hypothetical protein
MWLKKERPILNTRRVTEMRTSLVGYCRDKLAQIAGEQIAIDVVSVRDDVAINACGGPFSSVIQAVAGSQIVPCAYEDEQGLVYFSLPKGTQSFKIVGRTLRDNSKPFTGEYTVVAAHGSSAPLTTPAAEKSKKETDTSEADQTMPDSESMQSGKSKGQEMEPEMDEGMGGGMNKKPKSDSMEPDSMKELKSKKEKMSGAEMKTDL